VESAKGLRTENSDRVTGATAPPVWDAKWTRALRPRPLFNVDDEVKDGPEHALEECLSHGWDDEGQLKLLAKWFGFPVKYSTWQFASFLLREEI